MRSAVIDMGSNTVRLCIFDLRDGKIETLFSQKEAVGLAGYIRDGALDPDGIRRVCAVLKGFRGLALKFVSEDAIRVFATASLRSIANKDFALDAIRLETSLSPETLTGEEEAYLDFVGAAHGTALTDGFLVDIGGASTELVCFAAGRPQRAGSLPIGCLSLYAAHMSGPIASASERESMRREIRENLDGFEQGGAQCHALIGVGGSVRTALKLSRTLLGVTGNSAAFPAENARLLREMFESGGSAAYRALYKAAPERVLTICPGLLILEELVRRLRCTEIRVSKYGVREGFYIDRVLHLPIGETVRPPAK
jgi:exopolyphosphatase/guanosine-5'-triphosphate,3'-diphosphate pyrophosphatase